LIQIQAITYTTNRLASSTARPPWPVSIPLQSRSETQKLQQLFSKTLEQYETKLEFVAEKLGGKGVTELEQLATALYAIRMQPETDTMEKARYIHQLKPHVSVEEGTSAIENVETIISEAAKHFDIPVTPCCTTPPF